MATRPSEPNTLGTFFVYPQDAARGLVARYWLASSPGTSHRVRMNGECKRAFLATIEAVLERAIAPATCGTYPDANTDFKAMDIDTNSSNSVKSLVTFTRWKTAADRAGLGARLVRWFPREDWNALVSYVAAMWGGGAKTIPCGEVYAWQTSMLDYSTQGWVEDTEITGAICFDLSFYVADEAVATGSLIELRLWGDYLGGAGGYPVAEWVANALIALGANVQIPSATPGGFANYELNGSPAPLKEGHEGNWFDSSSSAMVGQHLSVRRSSSAWAVLQAMLANMRFTHLKFPITMSFSINKETRLIWRYVMMDEHENIVTGDYDDSTASTSETSGGLVSYTDWEWGSGGSQGFAAFHFVCMDTELDEYNPLVLFNAPTRDEWGWTDCPALHAYLMRGVGRASFAVLKLTRHRTTGITSVTAGNGDEYPALAFQPYIDEYGDAVFVDSMTHSLDPTQNADWKRYSVKTETGNKDLSVPVQSHAQWLMGQIPSAGWPSLPDPPRILADATRAFQNGWRVMYTNQPNIQVDGVDAYFPVKFANHAFVITGGWNISHDDAEHCWKGGPGSDQGEIIPPGGAAFPGLDLSSWVGYFEITPHTEAMAAHKWSFKAMPVQES